MPRLGQQIGPFTLKRRITSSPTHSLFYASKPEGTRNLDAAAIHCVNLDHQNAEMRQDQDLNYQYLQELEHPNIPPLYQYYSGQYALAREWIEGITLTELLEAQEIGRFDLDLATILDIIFEITQVLSFLHYQTPMLFHGRLNADHILLDHQGTVYVIGLHHQKTDNIPAYSSPEQSAEAFIDWRTDLWAIGALLAHLVIKEPLYSGRPNPLQSAKEGNALHWVKRACTRYPVLKGFFVRTLNPAAGDRFSSMEQLQKGIRSLQKRIPETSQRLIIAQIAYDIMQDSSLRPPLVRKIQPPPFARKDPSLDSLLPPDGPTIEKEPKKEEDTQRPAITQMPEPEIPEPHIEHPEHTSPAIPMQSTLKEESEPELPDEDKTEVEVQWIMPSQEYQDDEDALSPLELETKGYQKFVIGLIVCNTILLLYFILRGI